MFIDLHVIGIMCLLIGTNVQATDSGIASSTYSGTSMVMDSSK